MSKRIEVKHEIRWELDGRTLSYILGVVQKKITEHGPDAKIDINAYDDYGSPTCSVNIITYRDQTPEEIARDLADEEKRREYRLKAFEALKKEFET